MLILNYYDFIVTARIASTPTNIYFTDSKMKQGVKRVKKGWGSKGCFCCLLQRTQEYKNK